MEKNKKSKAEYQRDKIAKKADYRRGMAKEQAMFYDMGVMSAPKSSLGHVMRTGGSGSMPTDNRKGEFLTGPLSKGESLLYMRAKRDAIKKAQEKKKNG